MSRPQIKVPVRRYLALVSTYLESRRGRFVLLAALLIGGIGLQLVIPQITRRFIDMAQAGAAYRALVAAALAFMGASLVQQAVAVAARYVGETVAWDATNDMRIDLARHALHLDMSYHNERTPGEMIERIDGDLLKIAQFFSQLVVLVIGSVLLLVGILVALAIEDLRLGGIFLGFSLGTLLLFVRLRNIAIPYDKANRETLSEVFGYVEERLAGTEDIRSSGAVGFVLQGLQKLHRTLYRHWRTAELYHTLIRLFAGIAMATGFAAAFVAGYRLNQSGVLTIGAVYMVIHYTQLLGRPIRMLVQQVQNLQEIGANVERVNDLFSVSSRIGDPGSPGTDGLLAAAPERGVAPSARPEPSAPVGPVTAGPASVAFRDVTFGYSPGDPVIRNVSFGVAAGEVLGLLGRTGSGKSTLARLIFRLYDPQEGSVLVDGADVRSVSLDSLRRRVAMVTQDVQIFQATVRENLTFFDDSVPDERLLDVMSDLGLSGWLARLPDGLDSRVEQGGRGLSAGEAQLLAFTRVFLKDPGLVILDEASSRLDPATEALIERVVDRLLENRSAIVIAHRLATVGRADSVLIMEDGESVEFGDRERLASDHASRFHALLRTGMEDVLA